MPRILITGLPNVLQGSDALRGLLADEIPAAVEWQAGFGIDRRHVYAHAVADLVDERPTRVVTFTIEGLIDRPERTAEMRRALCSALSEVLAEFLARAEVPYQQILGWCVRISADEDGFVRYRPESS